jgi:mannitol 2-dehydrogenase
MFLSAPAKRATKVAAFSKQVFSLRNSRTLSTTCRRQELERNLNKTTKPSLQKSTAAFSQSATTGAFPTSRQFSQAAAAMPHSVPAALKLNSQNLADLQQVTGPNYERKNVKQGIVHVGVGGFHRAHLAVYIDDLLNKGLKDWSICGVGMQPFDAEMRDALVPQDNLYTVIERAAGGSKAHVVGSITDYLFAPDNSQAVIDKMAHPDTHIVSMTITESGYYYNENTHELDVGHPDMVADLSGKGTPRTFFGFIYAALEKRHAAGLKPFTVLSCDNMQKNGDITRNMMLTFSRHRNPEIAQWLEQHGAFPNSMVDRITPRTVSQDVTDLAQEFSVEDAWPVVTEPFKQWVIEDKFADGRPPFEEVGVQVVKEVHDVEQFELMKLRLLNASHSAMAYLAFLGGFEYVHEVIGHPRFSKYIHKMMHEEVKPLLPQIPGVDTDKYCQTLIERFSNPTLKDEVTRICLGGSGKLPQFIMPSIAEQIIAGGPLRRLTLATAGWFRYLDGRDEKGQDYKVNDPLTKELTPLARKGGKDPMVLLGVPYLFGDDLRNDKRFVTELTNALESLYEEGAMVTLEKYVD